MDRPEHRVLAAVLLARRHLAHDGRWRIHGNLKRPFFPLVIGGEPFAPRVIWQRKFDWAVPFAFAGQI